MGAKKEIAKLRKGEKITAITGEVHSAPYEVKVTQDQPEGLRKGETIYFLTPLGEGTWRVWRDGKVADLDVDSEPKFTDFVERAKKNARQSTWWIQIRMKNGKIGWVKENQQFDPSDMDSCS